MGRCRVCSLALTIRTPALFTLSSGNFPYLGKCDEALGSITSICDQRWGQYWGSLHTHLGKYLHMGRGLVGQLCPPTGLASSEGLMPVGYQTRSHVGLRRCGLGYKDLGPPAQSHRMQIPGSLGRPTGFWRGPGCQYPMLSQPKIQGSRGQLTRKRRFWKEVP